MFDLNVLSGIIRIGNRLCFSFTLGVFVLLTSPYGMAQLPCPVHAVTRDVELFTVKDSLIGNEGVYLEVWLKEGDPVIHDVHGISLHLTYSFSWPTDAIVSFDFSAGWVRSGSDDSASVYFSEDRKTVSSSFKMDSCKVAPIEGLVFRIIVTCPSGNTPYEALLDFEPGGMVVTEILDDLKASPELFQDFSTDDHDSNTLKLITLENGLYKLLFPKPNMEYGPVSVMDVSGHFIFHVFRANANGGVIDLRDQASGLYFIRAGQYRRKVLMIK